MSFAKTGAALLSLTVENVSEWILPDDRDSCPGLKVRGDVRSAVRQPHSDVLGAAGNVTSGGASFVPVVQATDFPECDHVTLGDTLYTAGRWRVFRQREMRSRSMIVRNIAGQDLAQMLLAEYHHVVQAVAPD